MLKKWRGKKKGLGSELCRRFTVSPTFLQTSNNKIILIQRKKLVQKKFRYVDHVPTTLVPKRFFLVEM